MEDLNDKVNNGGASAAGKLANTEWNQAASEIQNAITAAGLALSSGDLTQLLVAVSKFAGGMSNWCNDSGTSSAYVLTPLYTVAMPLFTGLTVSFRPANNNTITNPTVNYNGTGVKNIKNESGNAISVDDLDTTRDATMRYDGTSFRLLTNSTNVYLNSLYKKSYISGFGMSCLTTNDADYGVIIGGGDAIDAAVSFNLITASQMEKSINTLWSVGDGGGAKPAAVTLGNNAFYRVFVIGGAGADTDFGIDTSSTATNLLTTASLESGDTYNKYRQIGWIMTDGTAKLKKFVQQSADYTVVWWIDPVLDHTKGGAGDNPSTSRTLVTVAAPPSTEASIIASINDNSGTTPAYYCDIRMVSMTDVAASSSNHVMRAADQGGASFAGTVALRLQVDASSQIAYRFGGTGIGNSTKFNIVTRGFRYTRSIF